MQQLGLDDKDETSLARYRKTLPMFMHRLHAEIDVYFKNNKINKKTHFESIVESIKNDIIKTYHIRATQEHKNAIECVVAVYKNKCNGSFKKFSQAVMESYIDD